MCDLCELFFELFGSGLVVRAHYGANIFGAVADSGMWEHVIDGQLTFLPPDSGGGVDGVASSDWGLLRCILDFRRAVFCFWSQPT